ncbi:MAG: hypothetical protein ACR2FY_10160 [Pirellulaceae bacterium]
MKKKMCPKCGLEKATGLFSKNRRNPNGLCSWCKECMKAAVKAWNKKNRAYKNDYNRENRDPEYRREYYRKHGKCAPLPGQAPRQLL